MSKKSIFLSLIVFIFLAGCNPYASHFQCPETFKGECVPVQTAYKQSLLNAQKIYKSSQESTSPSKIYKRELFNKYAKLIKSPKTPLVVPPDVGRVLILSYTGEDNILYSWRYIYFFLDQPRWILSLPTEASN